MIKITDITVTGYTNPSSCEDRSTAQMTVIEADGDTVVVEIDGVRHSTKDADFHNFGHHPVAIVMLQVLTHVDQNFSGYLHNYGYTNGHVHEAVGGPLSG